MSIKTISNEVAKIRQKHDEAEPARLCGALGILLLHEPMGDSRNACKGFYLRQSRAQVITVNSDLSEEHQRIILAHELGHAVLHRDASAMQAFHDFKLFDETTTYEYEANVFAADYLMPDEEVLELLCGETSFFDAASELGVPPELLDFKFRVLKRKGYKVVDPPITARADFLKKLH
jgi:Zn-dependent peptidase ImmA (M78 family)